MDTDLFFPPENIGGPREGKGITGERDRIGQAKQVCSRCPVRAECLSYAIDNDCSGIYGGTTEQERNRYAGKHE